MNNNPTQLTLAFLTLEYNRALRSARNTGFKGNQATQKAERIIKRQYGPDCLRIMELGKLMREEQENFLSASELGVRMGGISAQQVLALLKFKGMIESYRDAQKRIHWAPTGKGLPFITFTFKKFSLIPPSFGAVGRKHSAGTSGPQLIYKESILEIFENKKVFVN